MASGQELCQSQQEIRALKGSIGAGQVRAQTMLCVLRGFGSAAGSSPDWPGARLAWHFHQSSWNYSCCLFMTCARVWIEAWSIGAAQGWVKALPKSCASSSATSFPKIRGFPILPYTAFSLTCLFLSLFLWIHLSEFPAVVLRFLLFMWGGQRVARPAEQVLQPPPAPVNKFITSPILQPRGFRQAERFIILLTLHSS